jgi:zinc protease
MMLKLYVKLSQVALVTILSTTTFAQKSADIVPLDKSVKFGKLPNGLTYYIRRNVKPENKVELRLVVNAGSVLERNDQQGVAHFLEHMAFNGTKNFPKNQLTEYLQKSGVRFGADLNASTSFDETIYMLPLSTKDAKVLSNGYQVIRDWAGNLLLDQSEIDKERGIILEEKRMRQGAGMRGITKYFPVLTNGSMYGERIPIGKEDIIKTAPRKVFSDFYTDWYRPNNMAVIAVGDIDVNQTEATIKKLFSDLKNPAKAPTHPAIIPIQWHKADKAFVVTDDENTNNILQLYIGLHKQEDQTKWSAYGNSLQNQMISSLFGDRLSEYSLQAKSPIGFGNISLETGQFRGYVANSIFALVKTNTKDVLNTMVAEVLKAKQFGFTKAEFERAKKDIAKNYEDMDAEKDKTESASFAREYGSNFLNNEPAPGIEAEKKYTDQYLSTLTLEKINMVVAKINLDEPTFILYNANTNAKELPTESALLMDYTNAKKQVVVAYEEKAVSKDLMDKVPVPGTVLKTTTNTDLVTKNFELSNGIKVIYKKTDFKNDEILLKGYQWGGLSNLTEKEAQLSFYLQLINQLGVGSHNASELQKMMSGVKASAFLSANNNTLSVFGNAAVTDFEKMLQLLHLKLTNINFDAEEIAGIKSSFAQQIGNFKKNPSIKFNDTLNRFRYNFNKRISSFPEISEIEQVNTDEVKNVYLKLINNLRGLTLIFVGNINEGSFQTLVEKYIASIPTRTETVTLNKANILKPIKGKNNFLINGGKENKSEINLSYYGDIETFDDKENMSYGLLAEVLQMKTTEKLREEMGGTYSPRVGGQMSRAPMLEYSLNLNVPSAVENVDKLVAAFDGIIKSVIAGGVSDDDMLKAKEQRKKTIETQLKTNNFWLSQIESQDMYQYDSKLLTNYFTRLDNVKKEDLVSVAKKYLTNANVLKAVMNPETK